MRMRPRQALRKVQDTSVHAGPSYELSSPLPHGGFRLKGPALSSSSQDTEKKSNWTRRIFLLPCSHSSLPKVLGDASAPFITNASFSTFDFPAAPNQPKEHHDSTDRALAIQQTRQLCYLCRLTTAFVSTVTGSNNCSAILVICSACRQWRGQHTTSTGAHLQTENSQFR